MLFAIQDLRATEVRGREPGSQPKSSAKLKLRRSYSLSVEHFVLLCFLHPRSVEHFVLQHFRPPQVRGREPEGYPIGLGAKAEAQAKAKLTVQLKLSQCAGAFQSESLCKRDTGEHEVRKLAV